MARPKRNTSQRGRSPRAAARRLIVALRHAARVAVLALRAPVRAALEPLRAIGRRLLIALRTAARRAIIAIRRISTALMTMIRRIGHALTAPLRWVGLPGPGSVYRVELPDGAPERIAEGHGAAVSPDGRQLALIRGADVVILELMSGQERVLVNVVGEFGGVQTVWARDSRRLAVESSGADVSVVDIVDADTGEVVDLRPVGELEVNYRVISPRYRPSDGVLGVICCHDGEIVDGEPPQNTQLVLHDPTTGAERSRVRLPFSAGDFDWVATGSRLLVTDGDRVHEYSGGQFRAVPSIRDIDAVAW